METFHWDGKVELRRLCLKTVRRPSAEAPPVKCRSRGGNQVRAGDFLRVDRLDTSKEVCFVQINTGESRSDSLDMVCVLRVGY